MRRALVALALALATFPAACGDDETGGATAGGGGGVTLTAVPGDGLYAVVGDTVTFDGSASLGARTYQWNFGDGEGWDAPRDTPTAEHVYTEPGRYTAVLTVFDAGGFKHAASRLVSVTHPIVFEPKQSSTVARLPETDDVVVVSTDSSELVRFRHDEGQLTLVERIATCIGPRTVTAHQGWAIVPCPEADEVRFVPVDSSAPAITATLPRGSAPFGAVGIDDAVYVSLQGTGELARLDVAGTTATLGQRYDGLPDARGVAALPDGRVAVTRWRSADDQGWVGAVDVTSGAVTPMTLGFDDQLASDTESGGVPTYLEQLLVLPSGREAVVPSLQANIRQGLFVGDEPLTHETTVRAVISYLDLTTGLEAFERRKQFDDRGFAAAGVVSSRGDYAFLAMRGSRTVDRLDLLSGGLSGSLIDVGYAPQGVALSGDDRFLFVDAHLSRELVAYDVSDLSAPPQPISRGTIVAQEPLSAEVLRGKQLFNDSFDTRLAKDGYIACAHCHLDGADDHRIWDFTDRGEGLRNTLSLIGRAGAAPIHWSANFDEVHDFEHDIRGPFGGTGLMSDEAFNAGTTGETLGDIKAGQSDDLDALAAYVVSLATYPPSPFRHADGSLTADAQAGKVLFESTTLGCTTCHSGPTLSDSAFVMPGVPLLHDVGTLGPGSGQRLGGVLAGIDTPSLHGLWASAPYLHDGAAPTLLAVLTTENVGDAHGVTSGLSAAELDQLVAYLLSLDGAVD